MNIVILGSGFASLKLATLLSQENTKNNDTVILLSNSDKFIFLPLIPNILENSLGNSYEKFITDVDYFCKSRGIQFIQKYVDEKDIMEDYICMENGEQIHFDILFDGRGICPQHQISTYKKWLNLISAATKEKELTIIFDNPGIAEFEVDRAFKCQKRNVKVKFKNEARTFMTHPRLRYILSNDIKKADNIL